MSNQHDRLVEGVTEKADLHESLKRLLHNAAGECDTAAGNHDATRALGGSLRDKSDELIKHVLANVPKSVVHHSDVKHREHHDEDDKPHGKKHGPTHKDD